MTVEEIFNKLAEHMREGIAYHHEFMKAYDFLGLYGFSKAHEYHYLEETQGYVTLLHYYSTHYHKLLQIKEDPKITIIPDTWYKYTTMVVDTNTRKSAINNLMEKWIEWEKGTKTFYQEMYKELHALGEIAAANKIACYICDVDNELKHAEKQFIRLGAIEYNLQSIMDEQNKIYKKYKKKI